MTNNGVTNFLILVYEQIIIKASINVLKSGPIVMINGYCNLSFLIPPSQTIKSADSNIVKFNTPKKNEETVNGPLREMVNKEVFALSLECC